MPKPTSSDKACRAWARNGALTLVKQTGLWGSNVFTHGTDCPVWVRPKILKVCWRLMVGKKKRVKRSQWRQGNVRWRGGEESREWSWRTEQETRDKMRISPDCITAFIPEVKTARARLSWRAEIWSSFMSSACMMHTVCTALSQLFRSLSTSSNTQHTLIHTLTHTAAPPLVSQSVSRLSCCSTWGEASHLVCVSTEKKIVLQIKSLRLFSHHTFLLFKDVLVSILHMLGCCFTFLSDPIRNKIVNLESS